MWMEIQMTEVNKVHKIITFTQALTAIVSLSLASLWVVIEHPFLIYMWYLGLSSIASMIVVSFAIGISLMINRAMYRNASSGFSKFEDRLYVHSTGTQASSQGVIDAA
jgi:hypothetical protein